MRRSLLPEPINATTPPAATTLLLLEARRHENRVLQTNLNNTTVQQDSTNSQPNIDLSNLPQSQPILPNLPLLTQPLLTQLTHLTQLAQHHSPPVQTPDKLHLGTAQLGITDEWIEVHPHLHHFKPRPKPLVEVIPISLNSLVSLAKLAGARGGLAGWLAGWLAEGTTV